MRMPRRFPTTWQCNEPALKAQGQLLLTTWLPSTSRREAHGLLTMHEQH